MPAPTLDQIMRACLMARLPAKRPRAQAILRKMWEDQKAAMYANNFFFNMQLFKTRVSGNGTEFVFCGLAIEGNKITSVWIARNPPKIYGMVQRIVAVPFYSYEVNKHYDARDAVRALIKRPKPDNYAELQAAAKAAPSYVNLYKRSSITNLCFA